MENRQKVLQSLGLARRAKKLTTGIDLVIDQVRLGKAYLVFCANDAGQSTKKKITDKFSLSKGFTGELTLSLSPSLTFPIKIRKAENLNITFLTRLMDFGIHERLHR